MCNSFQMRQEWSKLVSVEIFANAIGATSICLFFKLTIQFPTPFLLPIFILPGCQPNGFMVVSVLQRYGPSTCKAKLKSSQRKTVRVKTVDYNLVCSITSTTNVANELCYPCRRQDLSGEENQPRNVSSQEKRDKKKKRKKLQQVS